MKLSGKVFTKCFFHMQQTLQVIFYNVQENLS